MIADKGSFIPEVLKVRKRGFVNFFTKFQFCGWLLMVFGKRRRHV